MNEFEKLEAELKELRPLPPSEQFHARLEKALGDAGNVALYCLPDEEEVPRASTASKGSIISFPRLITFAGLSGLGLAAVWAIIFYLSSSIFPDKPGESANPEDSLLVQSEMSKLSPPKKEDPDSPLHGLSLDQIQDISVMPVSGWSEPQNNERFLRLVDEGIFNRPGRLPARRVRHYFIDETLWSHPASDTRILSTTPREEVMYIELETY